jgi:aminopeptidase N
MKKLGFLLLTTQFLFAQEFTRRDSLQGGLRFERTCFDVLHYDLDIKIDPDTKSIAGVNLISFNVVDNTRKIQIDLFENMLVDSIIWQNKSIAYQRIDDAVFVEFPEELNAKSKQSLYFYYHGNPLAAKNAPWDGGFVWKRDHNNKHFVGVAVQGTGASLWFPVKDHQSDEPNLGATIKVAVPNGLMNVSNGRYIGKKDLGNGFTRWDWEVNSPINNYNITINIGDYQHIYDRVGDLDLDYYVLKDHVAKAKKHFEEVKPMMQCFENKFGKYPFTVDGYKLVETPYLGMEHQSAIAYGNQYKKGYLGSDMTRTGVGMLFDYITIHETGHEWFGNSVTSVDIADMWIHESFTTYAESVFVECEFGYDKAQTYINGQKSMVRNRKPVIGQFGVNFKTGNSDMYYKGALMLNTIRHVLNNDNLWWELLKDYSENFRHKIIETKDVVTFFNEKTNKNLTPIFEQYLRHSKLPELKISISDNTLTYYWNCDVIDFEMPFEMEVQGTRVRLNGTQKQQTFNLKSNINSKNELKFNQSNFFITVNIESKNAEKRP